MQNIVDELRELKELAIDAANDSNTDEDRRIMQKVLEQKQANIEDIAINTTFNTKRILDGTYEAPRWKEHHKIQFAEQYGDITSFNVDEENTIEKTMTLRKVNKLGDIDLYYRDDVTKSYFMHKTFDIKVRQTVNTMTGLAAAFEAMHNGVTFADGTRAVETRDTALYSRRPEDIDSATEQYIALNRNFIRSGGGAPLAVRLDFSGARDREGHALTFDDSIADQLEGQGFCILSSNSCHFVNILFTSDASGDCEWDMFNKFEGDTGGENDQNDDATGDIEYRINLGGYSGNTQEQFLDYIFMSIRDCEDRQYHLKSEHKLRDGITYIEDNPDNFGLSQQFNLRMARDKDGNVYLTKWEPYSYNLGILDEGTLQHKYLNIKGDYSRVNEKYDYEEYIGNPLWIQHGDKAGQHMNICINSMRISALGIDGANVTTRDRALASIDYADVALEYALDQATRIGAYLERMEYTESNVEIEKENIQTSESAIRDADMAKEMTTYTKYNILAQASQSMLAQANQLMSSALTLLQ